MDNTSFAPGNNSINNSVPPPTPQYSAPEPKHFLNKKFIVTFVVLILLGGGAYTGIWYWQNGQTPNASPSPSASTSSQTYRNNQYGFSISLSNNWKGYTVLDSQWEGRNVMTDYVVDHGPIIILRHPLWTTANPREDMPIMIFTPDQWADVKSGKTSLGAAPIPPSVLGQNSKYIIALPARYNYDYKIGFEEVDQLVHTLKVFEPSSTQAGTGTLTGHVTIGPNCPVERVGVPCTPSPEAYTSRQVMVYKADSTTLVTIQNFDTQGNYSIALPAGTYVVKSRTGISPVASIVGTITIKNGQTTMLNFNIDTGIR